MFIFASSLPKLARSFSSIKLARLGTGTMPPPPPTPPPSPNTTPTTHAIFDLGGTILDLEQLARDYSLEVCLKLGLTSTITPELVHKTRHAGTVVKIMDLVLDHQGIKLDAHEYEALKTFMVKRAEEIPMRLMPGVDRLIHHLYDSRIPMAIATNSSQEEWQLFKNTIVGFDENLFDLVLCGRDDPQLKNTKPAPDIYWLCAKRFPTPPKSVDSCVIFEDSLVGITGAVASGMKTVLINSERGTHFDAIAPKVTQIVDTFNNFVPESIGLPPYL